MLIQVFPCMSLFMNHEVWSDPMLIQVFPCMSLFMNHEVWSDPMLIQVFPCMSLFMNHEVWSDPMLMQVCFSMHKFVQKLWRQHSQASPSWCWENQAHWTPWTPAGEESGCYTSEITGDDVSYYLATEDVLYKYCTHSTLCPLRL